MHDLPIWFLILSLFLPRLALFIDWISITSTLTVPFVQPWAALCWFFIPRFMVLMMIYNAMGAGGWFYIHLIIAIVLLLLNMMKSAK